LSAPAISSAVGVDDGEGRAHDRVLAQWRRLASRHRRAAAGRALVRGGVLAAMPAVACALAEPTLWPWAAVGWLVVAGVAAAVGASAAPARGTEWCDDVRAALPGNGDALLTWAERRAAAPDAMSAWLLADLDAGLPAAGAPAVDSPVRARRPVWTSRWLQLAAAVAALALLLAWCLSPPWAGLLRGGTPPEPPPLPPAQPSVAIVAVPGNEGAPEPGTDPGDQTPADPEPPLDLPSKPEVVMPRFLADGPSRKDRANVAELPAGAAAATELRPGGGDRPLAPTAEEFRRAAERAQRARHVAPDEQAMVRRYFEGLRRAGGG
jgi:hypothetical protein